MPERKNPMLTRLGRDLRALWATLAVICLLGAGAAYGATRYFQDELEADATRDARKLAMDVLGPELGPGDVTDPIYGARYHELLTYVRERVLAGPILGIRLWRSDGTILFANVESLVGDRDASMRGELHDAIAGTSRSVVEEDRFRTLTSMRIGEPPTIVTAELIRSHEAIVEKARVRWYPWFTRGLIAAGVCAALYVATAIVFALVALLGRLLERRKTSRREARPVPGSRAAPSERDPPAYMRPGFREEVEARRRMADEMAIVQQERDEMEARLHRVEHELDEAQGRPALGHG